MPHICIAEYPVTEEGKIIFNMEYPSLEAALDDVRSHQGIKLTITDEYVGNLPIATDGNKKYIVAKDRHGLMTIAKIIEAGLAGQ